MSARKLSRVIWSRRRELLIVALMNLIYAFSYFQRVAVPGTIYNELQSTFFISSAAVALLGGIYFYIYGGMQIFAGMLADRYGPVRVILAGGALLSVGSVLFPLSGSLAQLYATRVMVGLGGSLMFLSVVKALDINFSDRHFSALLSSSFFAGYAGGLIGTRPFEGAVRAFGWRPSLLAVGLACCLAVALTAFLSRHDLTKRLSTRMPPVLPSLKRIMRNRAGYSVMLSGTIVFANSFLLQAVIGKKLLEDCCGLSSATAALYTFILMITSMAVGVFAGFFSRLIGNRRRSLLMASCLLAVLAPCLGLVMLRAGAAWALPCYLLFGASSCGSPIYSTVLKEVNDPDYAASAVGLGNGITYLSVAVYTTLAGIVLDAFSAGAVRVQGAVHYPPQAYAVIFYGMLALALTAALSSLLIRETSGRNIWAELHSR